MLKQFEETKFVKFKPFNEDDETEFESFKVLNFGQFNAAGPIDYENLGFKVTKDLNTMWGWNTFTVSTQTAGGDPRLQPTDYSHRI